MPYWVTSTLAAMPFFLWVYVALGVPLALIALPRADWRDKPLVLTTGFALGAGTLTVVMFGLGSFERVWLTRAIVLVALGLLTVGALAGAFYKARRTSPVPPTPIARFSGIERLLLGLLVVAVLIRIWVTAYWAFSAYDALWVYGYEGRLYFLKGYIPHSIGYYPQFLPLQYTFGQLMVGQISDSAARAVLPLLHVGSILAAYTLGARNFNRRVGLFLAGLWAFYPAVAAWARMGDLEIPLTFLSTLSATFFFMAWRNERPTHYALLGGIIYGFALFTKPTAGAFALGVAFINGVALVGARGQWAAYVPKLRVSVLMAVACAPVGGAWYLRNLALGHRAVDFPPMFWHSLAERGGGQLLWWVLIGALCTLYLTLHQRRRFGSAWVALTLIGLGVLPSTLARFVGDVPAWMLWIYPSLEGLPRLGIFEWLLVAGGTAGLVRALAPPIHEQLGGAHRADLTALFWMLGAALPYFMVYFWRYSYHYRLSFAIVPLLAAPVAYLLANWREPARVPRWALHLGVMLAALPAIVLPIYDINLGWRYLWSGTLADDNAKIESGNEALMWMVQGFQIYEQENGAPPIIAAPGVQRLPFFFPLADIRQDAPTRLEALEGVTYFVDSHPDGSGMYEHVPILQNQVLSALGRTDIMRKAWWKDDGIFRYEIYELNLENRFIDYTPLGAVQDEVIFGGFARFKGHELGSDVFQVGERRVLKLFWEVLDTPTADYMTFIHLRDADGNLQMAWDGPVGLTEDGRYYTTLVWETGEFITDERLMRLTNEDTPPADGYTLTIGLYDLATQQRVPVTVNGEHFGEEYTLDEEITVIGRDAP